MRNIFLLLFFIFYFFNTSKTQTAAEREMDSLRVDYIRKYKDIAMDEMERSGIPASIKLAQGILESRAGTSVLAQQASNHFGIKCGKGWKGESYSKFDDERDKHGRPLNSCFRKYPSVVECFADHSEFIRNPDKSYRYGFLFQLDPRDYKAWAEGLQKAGYSSANHYAERLIYYIELHQLNEYDLLAYNGRVALKRLAEVNAVKMIQARAGESISDIARLYNLPVEKLFACNDYQFTPDQPLGMGAWVYVQGKRDSWSGQEVFHSVEAGQGLFDIAQRYGIRLENLQKRNGLKPGEEPANYEYVRLRGERGVGEKLLLRKADTSPAQSLDLGRRTAKSVPSASTGFTIEMLPETVLPMPVPAYTPEELMEEVVTNKPEDNEPEITIDIESGETRIYHTVRHGETLYSIAQRFRVSTASIRQFNQIKDNVVRIGQSLRIQ